MIDLAKESYKAEGFTQGVAFAAAMICRTYDQPSMAYEIMQAFDVNPDKAKRVGCEEYDLKPLRKMWKQEHKPRKRKS